MSEALVSVRRRLVAKSYNEIQQSRKRVTLYPDQVKWRDYEHTGLTYVTRGQYARNASLEGSKLETINPKTVASSINSVTERMPTESGELGVKVIDVQFLGNQAIKQIAYILEPDQLMAEWYRLTRLLDRMNNKQGDWDNFLAHLSVATVGQSFADEALLREFYGIKPDHLSLDHVRATPL